MGEKKAKENKSYLVDGNKKIAFKPVSVITGKMKKEIGKLVMTKPVNQIAKKINELIKKTPELTEKSDKQISVTLLRSGVVDVDDLTKYKGGDYVPDNYDEYMLYLYKMFLKGTEVSDKAKSTPLVDAIYSGDTSDEAVVDFMDEQDIEMIERQVAFFRSRIKFEI